MMKILFAVICLVVMSITPFFVKAQMNGPCARSMLLKMTGATGYVAIGLLGVRLSGDGFSVFDMVLLGALIASWIGDLFLHSTKMWSIVVGFFGFLSAHFFFIAAYSTEIAVLNPGQSFFVPWQIAVVLVLVVLFLVFSARSGFSFSGIIKVGIVFYGAVITTMMCKAIQLGYSVISAGVENAVVTAVVSIAGAILFCMSDFSISILMFVDGAKKNIPLKMFNMFTYFAAELLLASLTLLI